MSLFEFVTVMVSMILALTLGQLLMSASSLAKERRNVIPFAPYTLWIPCLYLTLINHWWSLWDLHDIDWTYAAFLYVLIGPTLVFFAVGLMVHKPSGDGPVNLQTDFEQVRPLFMAIMFGYVASLWFDGPLFADQATFGLIGFMHIPMLGVLAAGFLFDKKSVQVAAPILITAVLIVIMTKRFLS